MLIILILTNYLFVNAIKSKNFVVYYKKDSTNAVKVCNFLEKYKGKVLNTTGGCPPKPYIFIEDLGTIPNGYSDPMSRSISIFNHVPEPDLHFGMMKSWWRTVSVHEYTHHAQLSNIGFPANLFRLIFGKIYLPNMLLLPSYMHEGIAVYNESNLDSRDGRLNEGFFDAYLNVLNARRKLRQGVYLNHDPADYPQGEIIYLMGSEFTEFLVKKYGEEKLKEYYNTIGRMPFTIPLIDIPSLVTFKKPMSSIWREWHRELRLQREYYLPPKFYVDRGYNIKYLRNIRGKIYYVKTNHKKLSWNHDYYESELWAFNPSLWRFEKIYIGDISLPPAVSENSIYFGISNIKKGNSNISYLGLHFTNAIVKVESCGRFTYLLEGRIRAFYVLKDTIFYALDEVEGSSLWKFWEGRHEKIEDFKELKIQQILLEDNFVYLLAHRELEGNQIYRWSKEGLVKISNLPFEVGYFEKKGNELLFPGNYNGKWSLFLLNLEDGKLKIFEDPVLAFYPASISETVYYVTLDVDGEYIKTTSIDNFTDISLAIETELNKELNQRKGTFSQETKKISDISYLKELAYPDLILPLLNFSINSLQDLKSVKIDIEGVQLQGHSPLNLVEYYASVYFRQPRISNFTLFYNGLPATSLAFSLSPIKNQLGFGVGNILHIKNYGYLRQINLYGELFPWTPQYRFSSVILAKIYPDVYQIHSFGVQHNSENTSISLYHSTKLPIAKTFLLCGEFGIISPYPPKKIKHFEDVRLTLPFLRVNWGNDAIFHFFYERNFLTLEILNLRDREFSDKSAILSLDHLFSIINGNFKVALRTGLMKKFGEPIPYIHISLEPASVNFSYGIFKKRWLLREITGAANLL